MWKNGDKQKKESEKPKRNLSSAPFRLSNEDMQLADRRGSKVCVPVGQCVIIIYF